MSKCYQAGTLKDEKQQVSVSEYKTSEMKHNGG